MSILNDGVDVMGSVGPAPTPPDDEVVITSPSDGAVDVNPLAPVLGSAGAARAGTQVTLYAADNSSAIDATTVREDGGFTFIGTTPFHEGQVELWAVASDGTESAHVTFTTATADVEQDAAPERPPGNASTEDWAAYADAIGVDVSTDATRTQIIEAVDAAANTEEN